MCHIVQKYGQMSAFVDAGSKPGIARRVVNFITSSIRRPCFTREIRETEDTWKGRAIKEIHAADLIILHLESQLDIAGRQRGPLLDRAISDGPIYPGILETGYSHGLLLEFHYCVQENALGKTIVLQSGASYRLADEIYAWLCRTQAGRGQLVRMPTPRNPVGLTPKFPLLDRGIWYLPQVFHRVVYKKFGDGPFRETVDSIIARAIVELEIGKNPRSNGQSVPYLFTNLPRPMPYYNDDGRTKHIRFSKPYNLLEIPSGEIVELSEEEVAQVYPEVRSDRVKCPRCSAGRGYMFWYQYGAVPSLTRDAGTYFRCQYCGNDEYL